MEVNDSFRIVRTKGGPTGMPMLDGPSIGYDNIDDLVGYVEEKSGIGFNLSNSEKIISYFNGESRVPYRSSFEDESVSLEGVILKDDDYGLDLELMDYSSSGSSNTNGSGVVGGTSRHAKGVQGSISFSGSLDEAGIVEVVRDSIEGFYEERSDNLLHTESI